MAMKYNHLIPVLNDFGSFFSVCYFSAFALLGDDGTKECFLFTIPVFLKLLRIQCPVFCSVTAFSTTPPKVFTVFGIQTAGLSITLLAADEPTPYITRIQILKVKNQVFSNQKRNCPKDTSEWLNTCLNHDNVVAMPVTSTSTENVNKRRKVDS
ncbi:hypothetical protein BDF21DRAFT_448447 [Thamnidium elegans]|nr:hypothetical protein BDF21DRAFT_448447 [Thamnidium elegans]